MSKSPAIGIDFGTANSCVAVFHQGKVEVIPNDYGNRTTPSIVGFSKNGRFVGEMARTQQMTNLENTIFDVKRLIGREFFSKTVQDDIRWYPFKVDHLFENTKIKAQFKGKKKHFCPEEICAMILSKMKSTASEHLGVPVRNAVITVPAYFNDSQRQSIKDCGSIAGLNVLRIMNESSAAAIAYGFNNPKPFGERYLLVFDLGAGNFNISVIGVRGGLFDVRSVSGHTHLGGENFTRKLVNYCIGQFRDTYERNIIDDKRAIQRLRNACEEAKRSLTSATSAQIDLPALYCKIDFKITITRDKFEELCLELFKSLIPPFVRALADSKLSQSQIDEVILVGGSSRIPKIQQLLSDFFASKRLIVNTDEAVAIGAAIQAAILNGDQSNLLRERIKLFDVAPLSLGVELKDNRMGIVIPANTNIPTKRIKTFSVVTEEEEIGKVNKSRSMLLLIKVFEGESEFARDNHSLGHFLFQGSSSLANSNEPEFDVSFDIDENGILDVYALETGTDNRAELTVTGNKSRLPRKQIEEMKRDVELFQVEDAQQRELVNARNELETYISKIRSNVGSSTSNSNKIEIKLNKVLSWLDKNPNADKKDLNEKKTKIEKLVFASKLSIQK